MMDAVLGLPAQFLAGAAAAGSVGSTCVGVKRVLVCGMGGSAFPGDFLGFFARPRGVPVVVSRDYLVRDAELGPETLAVISSYSGDTEETLSAFAQVHAAGCRVVTVSAGGVLEREASRLGLPHVHFDRPDANFQPRAAMGYFFGAFTTILANAGLLGDARPALEALSTQLAALDLDAPAEALAGRLWDRIPVVYASGAFTDTAARVIKIKLNENAKMPAFFNGLPELNHNELVGYTRLTGPFTAIMLREPSLSEAMARRFDVTAETLTSVGVPVEIVALPPGTPEFQLFWALHYFDVVSVHIALRAGIDPTPVAMVEDFKRRLVARAAGGQVPGRNA
jgi:glucose/mannose-6-phosphate isomerase